MPTTSLSTTLLESVNIVLANLGESPVNSLSGGALPQQVSLALNTIEEVSTDIQSKGWWFNQKTGSNYDTTANVVIYPSNTTNEWGSDIPEEARRYITIRASRIAQTRLIGSEELQKFSYNEELVSLAILQQAHVRNSNGILDFNAFPAELRGLGMDEVMFLQGNVEEKIGTLRLGGELANIAKTKAETDLLADQEALVAAQVLTEAQNTTLVAQNAIKTAAEAGLVTNQQALIAQQVLDVVADVALKTKQGEKIDEEVDLLQTQDLLTQAQTSTELQNAIKVAAESGLITSQQALISQQVLDSVADVTLKGKQGSLIDQQVLTETEETEKRTSEKELIDEQTSLVTKQTLTEVQNAIKVSAESGLISSQQALVSQQVLDAAADITLKGKQGSLVDAQELKTDAETVLTSNQSSLVASQKTQLDATTAIEASAEKAFYDGVVAGTQDTYRDYAAEMRIMAVQESTFQQTPAYKKVELLKDAAKLRLATATETSTDATELLEVNKVMRFIGEPPVTALNSDSLASECVRLLRDTDTELQGRGWWFNIDEDGVIVPKALSDTPQKYREYLSVRVAILLTELYPQSGVDIQRLPKMEAELRAYFKDREFNDANYSIFDSYDVASRMGINRNYDLI